MKVDQTHKTEVHQLLTELKNTKSTVRGNHGPASVPVGETGTMTGPTAGRGVDITPHPPTMEGGGTTNRYGTTDR